jgi:hypothetical protein
VGSFLVNFHGDIDFLGI